MTSEITTSMRLVAVAWLATIGAAWCRAGEPTLAEEAAFRAAAAAVANAVVRIEPAVAVDPDADDMAAGPSTGLVIEPEAGSILTTSFAVPEGLAEVVVVLADGERRVARVGGRDRGRGVVLLRTEPIAGAPRVEPVPRHELRPGQWTIAVGRGWPATVPGVTVGILSATDRCWGVAVQTDAAVSALNYGGPLLDIAGRVIGLIVPLPADTAGMKRGSDLYDTGIGFAVPLVDLMPLVPGLRDGRVLEPGLLGIAYESRDSINGEPEIATVATGSPAGRAGLRAGDRIVSIDGRRIRRIADARHAIAPRHAGDTVTLEVERAAEGAATTLSLTATLAGELRPCRRGMLGIVVSEASGPARIVWLLPDGPAAAAGALAGDVVASIAASPADGTPAVEAPTAAAIAGFLAGLEPGLSVRLEVERGGRRIPFEVALTAPPAEVPADGPPPDAVASPIAAAIDPVKLMRLEMPDSAARPLAVVPRGGDGPLGLLIHFGPPQAGGPADAEAPPWQAAVAATGVAVILPGSSDRTRWSRDDIPAVLGAIQALNARRPLDPDRIAVSGSGAGAAFAWLVAERLGRMCRGVAVSGATMPRRMKVAPAAAGEARWILLGGPTEAVPSRLDADRRRLEAAGHVVGLLAEAGDPSPAVLCRWVSLLGLL